MFKKHLIKTRLRPADETDLEPVYLGLWACSWNNDEQSPIIDGEVLPFRWDDRDMMARDFDYLQGFYNRILAGISKDFSSYHQTDFSLRAWKILVGPFALHLLHSLFDRYHSIQNALSLYPQGLQTAIYEDKFAPANLSHWFSLLATDEFNELLYSKVIQSQSAGIEYKKYSAPLLHESQRPNLGSKDLIKLISSKACKYYNSILIQRRNSHLSAMETLKLYKNLVQIPALEPDFYPSSKVIDWEFRSQPLSLEVKGDFEAFIRDNFYWFFPVSLLESFAELKKFTESYLPKGLKHILMGSSFGNEYFSMSCALASQEGAKLSLYQHGGLYGTTRYSSAESFELDIADYYLSWGWKGEKVKPFYINKPLEVKPDLKQGSILVGLVSQRRYVYRLDSWIQGPQTYECGQSQIEFAKNLNQNTREETLFRFHRNYGWNEKDRFLKEIPDLKSESITDCSFHDSISKAKLFVGTYNTTMLLECMSSNFPCLFFWNPEHEEIREDAKPYYDLLHEAKILFYCPKKCAEFVNTIASDVMAWWNLKKTQSAVTKFCSKYAVKSENLVSELADFLKSHQS